VSVSSQTRSRTSAYMLISHEAPWSTMFQVCLFISYLSASPLTMRSCMRDIIGARFHCAICADVDICSNCESAGLPGDLHSSEGGHDSSHILIKVIKFSSIDTRMTHHRFPRFLTPWAQRRLVLIRSILCHTKTDSCSRCKMQVGVPFSYGRTGMLPMPVTLLLVLILKPRPTNTRELLHTHTLQHLHYLTRLITIS
jgi:hypothetical protein